MPQLFIAIKFEFESDFCFTLVIINTITVLGCDKETDKSSKRLSLTCAHSHFYLLFCTNEIQPQMKKQAALVKRKRISMNLFAV